MHLNYSFIVRRIRFGVGNEVITTLPDHVASIVKPTALSHAYQIPRQSWRFLRVSTTIKTPGKLPYCLQSSCYRKLQYGARRSFQCSLVSESN